MKKKATYFIKLAALCSALMFAAGCDSASEIKDLIDVAVKPPERKQIDTNKMGVNSFFVNPGFGSIDNQYSDIRNNLKLKYIRVLFAWTDSVQGSPNAELNLSFYDSILNAAPPGAQILVVLSHSPNWITDSANWDGGNARTTWVNKFLKPVINRYKGNPNIIGWEVFNEPDIITVGADNALGLTDPANYFELLSLSSNYIRATDKGKAVVIAATESINQKFPTKIDYQKKLVEFGAVDLVDIWNIHYYGEQYERVVQKNGVADFLSTIPRPIWVTESGEQGTNKQLAYVESAWPFLSEKIPNISLFFYYEYSSNVAAASAFGLRTTTPGATESDLYLHLRNR